MRGLVEHVSAQCSAVQWVPSRGSQLQWRNRRDRSFHHILMRYAWSAGLRGRRVNEARGWTAEDTPRCPSVQIGCMHGGSLPQLVSPPSRRNCMAWHGTRPSHPSTPPHHRGGVLQLVARLAVTLVGLCGCRFGRSHSSKCVPPPTTCDRLLLPVRLRQRSSPCLLVRPTCHLRPFKPPRIAQLEPEKVTGQLPATYTTSMRPFASWKLTGRNTKSSDNVLMRCDHPLCVCVRGKEACVPRDTRK